MQHNIGITLSGGGARGIAHTGVLKALEDNGIYPDIISGCSAGALVGSLYAQGLPPQEIFQFVEKKSIYSIVRMGMPNKGMMELSYFRQILLKNIPHASFEGLKKPFYLSVTNMNNGNCEIISHGNLIDFVMASSSIPILFKPVVINDQLYIDGGLFNNLPIEPIRSSCNCLIGVNVNPVHRTEKLSSMMEIAQRVITLNLMVNMESRMQQCDVMIEPDTSKFSIFSVSRAKELYDEGYRAAKSKVKEIKRILDSQQKN